VKANESKGYRHSLDVVYNLEGSMGAAVQFSITVLSIYL